MRGRFVSELSVVAGDPKLFDKSERGKKLRLFEQDLSENLFVEEIEAPGAKPDEVDEKDRYDKNEEDQDSERPLRDASKHGGVSAAKTVWGQSKGWIGGG